MYLLSVLFVLYENAEDASVAEAYHQEELHCP